ncbi:hypothetical protein ATN84_17995 [Paramesorhizobium deserti]|uniref:Uncharacterized protein n=1 Tax=Paramesorhizobium deserti TaxID=1494590 RepID=A0A135HRL6_9HYPH|nr:LecA/PA-IL family lectin [Paramesorhizobium deserti]KXF75849.1 hypothetical protein ATN84_17995 [Paramesorhizobium deserti]
MAEQSIWSGKLDASSEPGVKTGVTLNTRDPKITIAVTGSAKYAQDKSDFGPVGDPSYQNPNTLLPSANVGAVLMKVGSGPYRFVGNGLSDWTIREDGELTFFYNDWPGKYGDNSGSFNITVTREIAEPVADTLKYGDKVHLLNGYTNWTGGYLDVYGTADTAGAKYNVITATVSDRDSGSGTWLVESASGVADGTDVRSGDLIQLRNLYGNDGGYLDINGSASSPELYNVYTAEKSEQSENTLNWVVFSGVSGSNVNIGSVVHLLSQYTNGNGGFLDVCWGFAGANAKYGVYTTESQDRDEGSGSWKFLRANA